MSPKLKIEIVQKLNPSIVKIWEHQWINQEGDIEYGVLKNIEK